MNLREPVTVLCCISLVDRYSVILIGYTVLGKRVTKIKESNRPLIHFTHSPYEVLDLQPTHQYKMEYLCRTKASTQPHWLGCLARGRVCILGSCLKKPKNELHGQ
jgi:hypothetical protein